jgi:MFS family permease
MPTDLSTFRSLRVRNFRLFMAGQSVSVAGTWMQNVAVGWLVLELTHSGGTLGLVMAARFLPLVLLGPWGGLVADRHDKRRLLRITAACQLVIAGTLGALTVAHLIAVWSLAALIFVAGLVDVFDTPSRQTFINNLVGTERLGNAIALNSIVVNGARIVGPGVAGVLISAVGVGPCFLANAASYVAVIASLQAIRPRELVDSAVQPRGAGQIRAGLRYVRHAPELLVPLLLVAITGAFAWEFQVTLPLLTSSTFHGNSTTYGAALASVAAGSIVGGFVAARRHHVDTRTVALSAVAWGAVILAAAAAPNLTVAFVLLAFVGSGAVTFNSVSKTLLQLVSVEHMRGRVMALWSIGWQGTTVLGAPIVGYVGQWLGGRYSLGFGGLTTLLAGAFVLLAGRGRTRSALPANTVPRSASDSETAST